ncbi:MAG: Ig-like domain-containing protein [Bacteroidales bacterium]|nr:Ig-like domain-containing protein [Bacteroidales bacterium]
MIASCQRVNAIDDENDNGDDQNSTKTVETEVILFLSSITFEEGESQVLWWEIMPYDAPIQEVIWSSSNHAVASIDTVSMKPAVIVKSWNIGECVITATIKDSNQSATCKVTVVAPGSGTVVSKIGEMTEIKKGETAYFPQFDLSLGIENIIDGRCPIGLRCIDGGNVYVQFHLTTQNGAYIFSLQDDLFFGIRGVHVDGMRYHFVDVLPYPSIWERQIKTVQIRVTKNTDLGKWNLMRAYYSDANNSYKQLDYYQHDIIYDFGENNTLTVSGETDKIDDYRGHVKGTYYYQELPIPTILPAWNRPQMEIGGKAYGIFFGSILLNSDRVDALHIITQDGTLVLVK